jgi:hypothetical protein
MSSTRTKSHQSIIFDEESEPGNSVESSEHYSVEEDEDPLDISDISLIIDNVSPNLSISVESSAHYSLSVEEDEDPHDMSAISDISVIIDNGSPNFSIVDEEISIVKDFDALVIADDSLPQDISATKIDSEEDILLRDIGEELIHVMWLLKFPRERIHLMSIVCGVLTKDQAGGLLGKQISSFEWRNARKHRECPGPGKPAEKKRQGED